MPPDNVLNVTYRYDSDIDLPAEVSGRAEGLATRGDVNTAHNSLRILADSLNQLRQTVTTNVVFTDASTFSTPEEATVVTARANYNSVVVYLPATLAEWAGRKIVYKALVVATGYTLTVAVPVGADYSIDEIFSSVILKAYQAVTITHLVDNVVPVIIESSHLFDLDTAMPPISFPPEVRP